MIQTKHLDLSGTYVTTGFDCHDGHFTKQVHLTLDEKNSKLENGYAAYHYYSDLDDGTVLYRGAMLANGNHLALSFKSASVDQTDDQGVAIGVVSHDPNTTGETQTTLHFFYYQSTYQGGGNGSVVCLKNKV